MAPERKRGMSDARYRMALVRMKKRIEAGLSLSAVDSTTTGDKFTICAWGMCSEDPEQWPQAGDHQFPVDFIKRRRISPDRRDHQTCPLQTDAEEPGATSWGCFYKCRVFQKKGRRRHKVDRGFTLHLYDQRIKAVGKLPEVCGCDGTRQLIDPVGGDKVVECPDCVSVMKHPDRRT